VERVKANDSHLTEVNLDETDLAQSPDAEPLVDALAGNSVVTSLSFNNTGFDDSLIAALSLALVDNESITHISLKGNNITSEGCEYLMGTLDSNTTVSYLDLSGNSIDQELINEINAMIAPRQSSRQSSPQTNLFLGKPPMHEVPEESEAELRKRKAIMAMMSDNSIPWNEKNKRILQRQQQYYVPNYDTDDLHAADAQEPDGSIQALINSVRGNDRKLTKVELDGKGLSREDESALFEALANNKYVTSLSLRKNKIDNEGAGELCEALRRNSSLTHINLEENLITSNAALDFITCLKEHNDTVQYLELADNRVRSGLFSQMNKILEQRRPGYVEAAPVAAVDVAEAAKPKSKRASKKGREIV
jgi:hypothetical protein